MEPNKYPHIAAYYEIRNFVVNLIVSAISVAIAAYLLPGFQISGVIPLVVLVVVMGIINSFVRPVLLLLTLPFSIVTFGLFALVVNTLLIMLAGAIVPGVSVAGFFTAFLFGIVLAIVHAFLKVVEKKR